MIYSQNCTMYIDITFSVFYLLEKHNMKKILSRTICQRQRDTCSKIKYVQKFRGSRVYSRYNSSRTHALDPHIFKHILSEAIYPFVPGISTPSGLIGSRLFKFNIIHESKTCVNK